MFLSCIQHFQQLIIPHYTTVNKCRTAAPCSTAAILYPPSLDSNTVVLESPTISMDLLHVLSARRQPPPRYLPHFMTHSHTSQLRFGDHTCISKIYDLGQHTVLLLYCRRSFSIFCHRTVAPGDSIWHNTGTPAFSYCAKNLLCQSLCASNT